MRRLLWLIALAGCTTEASRAEPLAPLPAPAPVETDRFRDADACAQCHLVPDGAVALHDAAGRNVSPVLLWRSSMMALAARDPYYLAIWQEERTRAPERAAEIDALCSRCHAPAGSEELADASGHLSFDDVTAATTRAAALGRGGVTCTLCHQIGAANLGEDRSFSGGFRVGYQRQLFGRYLNPVTSPMQLIVNYTPTAGAHIAESSLCATCHTMIVPSPAGGEVVEQATFLEWRSSSYARQGQPCQSCHVPTVDESGSPITVLAVAGTPQNLGARAPFGRHVFVGGNAYVLRLLADGAAWSNAGVAPEELMASAARDEAHLATAAKVAVVAHDAASFTVRVTNLTGHKLPTGYPARRLWLHVRVEVGGSALFESGGYDERGSIVGGAGAPLPAQPHRDEIASADEAQIWEARLLGIDGTPTHRALDARRYDKDDRILPAGFAPTGADKPRTLPQGPELDPTFVAGSDDVTYRPPGGVPAGARVLVELLYESTSPELVDAVDAAATPAGARFVELARARPIVPVVVARSDASL